MQNIYRRIRLVPSAKKSESALLQQHRPLWHRPAAGR